MFGVGLAWSKACNAVHGLAGLNPARKIGPDAIDAENLANVWEVDVIV